MGIENSEETGHQPFPSLGQEGSSRTRAARWGSAPLDRGLFFFPEQRKRGSWAPSFFFLAIRVGLTRRCVKNCFFLPFRPFALGVRASGPFLFFFPHGGSRVYPGSCANSSLTSFSPPPDDEDVTEQQHSHGGGFFSPFFFFWWQLHRGNELSAQTSSPGFFFPFSTANAFIGKHSL